MLRPSLLLLAACAHHIAEPTLAPPTPDSTAADQPVAPTGLTKVCWVEMATGEIGAGLGVARHHLDGPMVSTQSGLLLVHPTGTWLVDAGSASSVADHVRETHGLPRFFLTQASKGWTYQGTIADAVRRAGGDPTALTGIVPTHGHFDHLGGIVDLPGVPVVLPQAEIGFAQATLDGQGFGVLPAEARALLPRARPLVFSPTPFLYWAESTDLLGDGSVVIWPMPGHTPGSVGLRVRLPDGRAIVLAGDTVWAKEGYEHHEPKGWLASAFDADQDLNDAQIGRLWALHRAQPELPILPAHDRRVWEQVFGKPGCVGG